MSWRIWTDATEIAFISFIPSEKSFTFDERIIARQKYVKYNTLLSERILYGKCRAYIPHNFMLTHFKPEVKNKFMKHPAVLVRMQWQRFERCEQLCFMWLQHIVNDSKWKFLAMSIKIFPYDCNDEQIIIFRPSASFKWHVVKNRFCSYSLC